MEITKILNGVPGRGGHLEDGVAWSTGISTNHESNSTNNKKNFRPKTVRYGFHNFYSSTIAVGVTNIVVAGNNKNRAYLLIQNIGLVTVQLGFSVPASITGDGSIELNPGFQIEFNTIVPNNVVNAICGSTTKLSILEGREE